MHLNLAPIFSETKKTLSYEILMFVKQKLEPNQQQHIHHSLRSFLLVTF